MNRSDTPPECVDGVSSSTHCQNRCPTPSGRGDDEGNQLFALEDSHGLMQRRRDFAAYQDLESRFEKRPSLWMEPIGDWGEGATTLIEIPTKEEIHDNIVAFWTPKTPITPGIDHTFTYRLNWGWDNPKAAELAKIVGSPAALPAATSLWWSPIITDRPISPPAAATVSRTCPGSGLRTANIAPR